MEVDLLSLALALAAVFITAVHLLMDQELRHQMFGWLGSVKRPLGRFLVSCCSEELDEHKRHIKSLYMFSTRLEDKVDAAIAVGWQDERLRPGVAPGGKVALRNDHGNIRRQEGERQVGRTCPHCPHCPCFSADVLHVEDQVQHSDALRRTNWPADIGREEAGHPVVDGQPEPWPGPEHLPADMHRADHERNDRQDDADRLHSASVARTDCGAKEA